MAEEASSKIFQLYRLAYSLIFCRSLPEILETATTNLAKSTGTRNAILWQFSASQASLIPAHLQLEDKSTRTRTVSLGSDFLGEVFRSGKPLFLDAEKLQESNKHVQFSKETILISGLCIPFKGKPELEGVLELVNKAEGASTFNEDDAEYVSKAMELVQVAAANMKSYEEQARNQLNAITRLTLLYDISQIFNSTLELGQLLPIIGEKIRDILDAETCTVWLLDETGEKIYCAKSSGAYGELFKKLRPKLEEDIAGEIIQQGEGILLEDASEDERLLKRMPDKEEHPVVTYMASPLECKGKILGTLEVLNRVNENLPNFNEEDQFLLNDLSHQAAVSIHNANLLQAERKAKELDALLSISHEITSTLNLDRVLLTIVNQAASLLPYDRAAIALMEKNKLELVAVSGIMEVDKKSEPMIDLQQILLWSLQSGKSMYISEFNEKIATDREETREKFKAYFARSGMKSFVSIPLKDEEGELGILSFESDTAYFLDERHLEVASILSNQATVAIRNAQLYRQMPLINIMGPIMQKKALLMKMPQGRRMAWGAGIALALAILILVPWNMKLVGDVTVLPARKTPVASQVEGIVKKVYLREGARIKKGTLIASLEDNDYRLALQQKHTERDVLQKEISRSQSIGDSASARMQQIQLDQVLREIEFYEYNLNATRIVAPLDGVLITPRIEEKTGSLLVKGEAFCEVADMRSPRAEIEVEEGDAAFAGTGQKVSLKMNAYATQKFYGTVNLLGTQLVARDTEHYYRLEAQIDNPDLLLKSGMVGKAKVEVGYRSIGYVLLRKPFRFIWKKFWVWLP